MCQSLMVELEGAKDNHEGRVIMRRTPTTLSTSVLRDTCANDPCKREGRFDTVFSDLLIAQPPDRGAVSNPAAKTLTFSLVIPHEGSQRGSPSVEISPSWWIGP
jgi:hypothetical protein